MRPGDPKLLAANVLVQRPRRPSSRGSSTPVKAFPSRASEVSTPAAARLPSEEGTEPLSELVLSERKAMLVKRPTSEGIEPTSCEWLMSRWLIDVHARKKDGGMVL